MHTVRRNSLGIQAWPAYPRGYLPSAGSGSPHPWSLALSLFPEQEEYHGPTPCTSCCSTMSSHTWNAPHNLLLMPKSCPACARPAVPSGRWFCPVLRPSVQIKSVSNPVHGIDKAATATRSRPHLFLTACLRTAVTPGSLGDSARPG